jgi:hypothetical protein
MGIPDDSGGFRDGEQLRTIVEFSEGDEFIIKIIRAFPSETRVGSPPGSTSFRSLHPCGGETTLVCKDYHPSLPFRVLPSVAPNAGCQCGSGIQIQYTITDGSGYAV